MGKVRCCLQSPRRRALGTAMCLCSAERQSLAVLPLLHPRVILSAVYFLAYTLVFVVPLYLGVGVYFLRKSTKNLRLSFLRMGVLRSRKRRLCIGAINVAFLVRSLVHPFPLKIRRQNLRLLYFYIPVVHPSTSGWACNRHRL